MVGGQLGTSFPGINMLSDIYCMVVCIDAQSEHMAQWLGVRSPNRMFVAGQTCDGKELISWFTSLTGQCGRDLVVSAA